MRRSIVQFLVFVLASIPVLVNGLAATKKPNRSAGRGFGASSSSVAPSDLTPDVSPEIHTLLQFLKSQKAEIDNVAVGVHAEHGRGLYATKNFSKRQGGQILCKIPSDCALALADPGQQQQQDSLSPSQLSVAEEGANLLQMYLENPERRQQFAAYLDTLPQAVTDATPDFFDEAEELPLLEFPRILSKARERKADIERVAKERGLDMTELQYATWLVTSRSFALAMSTDGETMAEFDDRGQVLLNQNDANRKWIRVLVPLLDLVNHSSNQPNARWTILDPQKDNAWFALQTTRPISAGQEILTSYGSQVESSVELLLNYGFVPQGNRIDAFMLQKGGDDCFASIDDWTTPLQTDEDMLSMVQQEQGEDPSDAASATLAKILAFRIQLKKAYSDIEKVK